MKPFIPNYIPSIGDVDAFLKVDRPDKLPEELGLSIIDEPTINGVDPAIFSLELSHILKSKATANPKIKSLEEADKNPEQIQNWVDQIRNLHREKMSSSVAYSKNMPDIEGLMQEWPEKMESTLKDINFPDERINMSLEDYAKLTCNMFDIPIHKVNSDKGTIEAVHVLFTLYSAFKDHQGFNMNNEQNNKVQSINFQSNA